MSGKGIYFECIIDGGVRVEKEKVKFVLVFPALEPIYLRALRYQAEIFNLTVFTIGDGKLKSLAVCHKNYYLLNKSLEVECNEMAQISSSPSCRHKRPERKLYVPPAQRKHFIKDKSDKTKQIGDIKKENFSDLNKICSDSNKNKICDNMNISDIIDTFYNLNLIPCHWILHKNNPNEHWNCNFKKIINFKNSINLIKPVPLYNLSSDNISWNYYRELKLYHPDLVEQKNKSHENFQEDNTNTQKIKRRTIFDFDELIFCEALLDGFDVSENIYKIVCDSSNRNTCEIINLSKLNLGHYCCVSLTTGDYVFECQEQHDVTICCWNKLNSVEIKSESIKKSNENLFKQNQIESQIIKNNNSIGDSTKSKTIKRENEHEQEMEIMRKTRQNVNRKIRPIMKYVEDRNDTLKIDKNNSVNDWEELFDNDGKIQDQLLTEIVEKVGTEVTIAKAAEDYSNYTNKCEENLEHVVELYNFPSTLETHDLVQAFSNLNSDAMYVKWVDDTHALLVLGSHTQAQKAVDMANPLIKVRPMTAASAISKDVASKSNLKPAMKRPPTNLQTARRLITTHLGTKSNLSKEQIAKEKEDLKNAKELKKLTKQNERDAWEGNIKSSLNQ